MSAVTKVSRNLQDEAALLLIIGARVLRELQSNIESEPVRPYLCIYGETVSS